MTKALNLLVLFIFVVSCAGSAEHKVVSANQAGDRNLSCSELDGEIVRAQVIIDGVNEDKSGISGADWVDGILWFPFNLIAKSQNYKNATQAADRRIEKLESIKEKKNCSRNQKKIRAKSASIVDELNNLTDLYKRGDITKSEYEKAKKELLR
tara:strand:+ start:354 stop:812 length:459 start_codon:yes stop_codon:yes gene_type:complete